MQDLTGRTLGRYRLDSLLGRGGMAEVYRATDTKLARSVAVKVIHPSHASDAQFLERFLREARVVASLDHPHILPIYDFGEDGGLPFLVMPYLDGGTLRDRLVGRPFPLPQAARWIRQLAEALDTAHEAGVLHRDVKPANVLVGKGERLALSDFGIAKILEQTTGLTAAGVVVGTPIYMAPEQAQGKPASPATDRYALAVLAYELLAGTPPFNGETALSLMHQHVTMPAPNLSTKVGGLPAGLDAVFQRALSKDPLERPPTCRALADAISAFVPTTSTAVWAAEAPTVVWDRPAEDATTAPTKMDALPRGSAPRQVADGAPGLTSQPTVVTGPAGARRRRLRLAAAGAAVIAAIAVVLWRRPRPSAPASPPVAPPIPTTSLPSAPPPAPTAAAPLTVSVQERGRSGAAPQPVEAGSRRIEALASAVDDAIRAGRLVPPAEDNALEALARLRREAPSSRKVTEAEERLVAALRQEAERQKGARDFERSKAALQQAQMLRPTDQEIEAMIASAETALKETTARNLEIHVPQPPDLPEPPEPRDIGALAPRIRFDPLKTGRRLTRNDFDLLLLESVKMQRTKSLRDEARFLETYSRGGLAFVSGRDAGAAEALAAVAPLVGGAGGRGRYLGFLLHRSGRGDPALADWELSMAYGDARGDAEPRVAAALAANAADARALFGRAALRRLQGRDGDAISDALRAYEGLRSNGPDLDAALVAEFLGDAYVRQGNRAEALRWYGQACESGDQFACQEIRGALRERVGRRLQRR